MSQNHHFGRVEIRPAERALLIDGVAVELGSRAFDLLQALIKHRDRLVTKDELMDMVWPGMVVEENNLQAQVSSLRKLLGPKAITTIQGRGYQFSLAETAAHKNGGHTASATVPVTMPVTVTVGVGNTRGTPSIAVLAFANHSASADDEYFSDGLADELLNVLTRIKGLHVAARTSSFSFKGKDSDIATIGQKLNVATVLEGSVRKSGNRARISVQLVNVEDGFHLWSESYDRMLDDIFAVQDDIAQSVVSELRVKLMQRTLSESETIQAAADVAAAAQGRSQNGEAHRLYLQARFFLNRHAGADIVKSIDYVRQALAIDPGSAILWATLSDALTDAVDFALVNVEDGSREALSAAQRAVTLEPALAAGHVAMCNYQTMLAYDWKGALASVQRALAISPDDAEALKKAGRLYYVLGRLPESLEHAERSVAQDPLNSACYQTLGLSLSGLDRLAEAEHALRHALDLSPDIPAARASLALNLLRQGKDADALAEANNERTDWARLRTMAVLHAHLGNPVKSDLATQELADRFGAGAGCSIASAYASNGKIDRAFEWLERAYEVRDSGLAYIKMNWMVRSLHTDPRWPVFLQKMGLDD